MRARRRRASLGVVLAVVVTAFSARAERAAPAVSVKALGASNCPGEENLVERIERRLLPASVVDPRERYDVEIEGTSEVTSARLVVTRADGSTATRVIQGRSCDDVFDSVSFVVAMTIDPETASRPKDPSVPLDRPLPADPEVASPAPLVAAAPTLGKPDEATPRDRAPSAPATARPGPSKTSFELGGIIEGTTAIAPYFAPVARLFFAVRVPTRDVHASLRLSGARSLENQVPVDADRGGYFTYTAGRVEGCVGPPLPDARLFVEGCAGADLGSLYGEGYGVKPVHDEARFWFALDALGRFGSLLSKHLAVVAEAGLVVPITRDQYMLHGPDALVFEPPSVAVSVGAGAATRFE